MDNVEWKKALGVRVQNLVKQGFSVEQAAGVVADSTGNTVDFIYQCYYWSL